MAEILAQPGQTVPLPLVLEDGNTTRFPQAKVYDGIGSAIPLATVNLVHTDGGYYFGSWLVPSAARFTVVYTVYSDSGHTTLDSAYGKDEDNVVSDQPSSAAGESVEAQLNVAYDDSALIFRATSWLDRAGATSSSSTTSTITVRDQANTLLFTLTSTTPYPNGVFFFQQTAVALLDNRLYLVEVSVTDTFGSASTIQTFSTVA